MSVSSLVVNREQILAVVPPVHECSRWRWQARHDCPGCEAFAREYEHRRYLDKLGSSYLVVGRIIVDRAAKSKSGDRETRLVLDKLELCSGVDWEGDAQKLLEGVYEARTGGDTLPFPGDDDLNAAPETDTTPAKTARGKKAAE